MGKASDLERHLSEHPLEPGERWPVRPELKLRADAPSIEVKPEMRVEPLLARLDPDEGGVVLRGEDGLPEAVVLRPEKYAELAGCEIESEECFQATLKGQVVPSPAALRQLMIEQVDPARDWKPGSRMWPLKKDVPSAE